MDRDAQHDAARRDAWETATSVAERIHKLTQVAADYPESMTTFADIAASYLAIDDLDKARTTYQHIVDHQRQFAHIWTNELGKAYLFTTNYEQAIATLEQSEVMTFAQPALSVTTLLFDRKNAVVRQIMWHGFPGAQHGTRAT
jgi:tetratricopeptide (TPR) repeat protein